MRGEVRRNRKRSKKETRTEDSRPILNVRGVKKCQSASLQAKPRCDQKARKGTWWYVKLLERVGGNT